MTTLSLTVPVAGTTDFPTAAANVDTDLNTIQTWANGNIDGTNVAATLTGRRLVTVGYVPFLSGGTAQTLLAAPDGNLTIQPGGNVSAIPSWAYLDPANFAVTGKSNTQLILRLSVASNATAPVSNFTAALYPVTFSGSTSGNIVYTLGTVVSGSSVTINTPGASASTVAETSAFTFPAAGAYVLTVANSATIAAGGFTATVAQLFTLNS